MINRIITLTTVSLLALAQASTFAAVGEVTKSGGKWTGKVDGVVVATGPELGKVASDTAWAMNSKNGGTLNIRAPGTTTTIWIYNNIIVDAWGNKLTANGESGIIRARGQNNVGARNVEMAGRDWFGMYFNTCNGQSFSGVNGTVSGIPYRIDNRDGTGYKFSISGTVTIGGGGSHGIETYGINGVTFETANVSDRADGCGVLLNQSSSVTGGTVNGTKCDYGGGYAGFRLANNNRSTTLTFANSVSCGRGFFSLTGSSGATVNRVDATGCSDIGVWLQDSPNTKVESGTVKDTPWCWAITGSSSGSSVNVNCVNSN